MTENEIKAALSDHQALACTMQAEADGDFRQGNSSVEERIAVGCVIRNRVRRPGWWGDSYRTVCLKRWQFSCWNPGTDANHRRIMGWAYLLVTNQPLMEPTFQETMFLAKGIISGSILDRVSGADHYYAPKAMVPKGAVPKWAKKPGGGVVPPDVIVGDQHFYNLSKGG